MLTSSINQPMLSVVHRQQQKHMLTDTVTSSQKCNTRVTKLSKLIRSVCCGHLIWSWSSYNINQQTATISTHITITSSYHDTKDNVENRGIRVNINKTKIMISGERQKEMQKAVRWLCGVCLRGAGNNLTQCTGCQKLVHQKCSGIKGSMYTVMKTFVCRGCMNPVTSTRRARTQPFYGSLESVRDNHGEPVPEETFTHSHLSWYTSIDSGIYANLELVD